MDSPFFLLGRQLRRLLVPRDLHAHRKRPDGAPVFAEVREEPARTRYFLELALGARSAPDVLPPEQRAEHLGQRDLAHVAAQAGVRAGAVVDVVLQRPAGVNRLWLWEVRRVSSRGHLEVKAKRVSVQRLIKYSWESVLV